MKMSFKKYLVVSLLLFLHPFNLSAQLAKQESTSKIEMKDNLITADLKNADLPEVLKEIEKATGVKISVVKELEGKKATANFENLDAESALRKLLGNNYVFVFSKEKDKYVLKEVMTAGDDFGSKISKGELITIEIAYGSGKGEVGAVKAGEGANIGPLSFAIDNEGNVYILDTVNNRIQIFSSSGVYLSTISLQKDIFPEDIAVDKYGFIYIVNSQEEKLYQFNKKGDIIKSISMGKTRWVSGEPIHIVNNKIYVYMCDEICGDKLIGEIDNGKLSVNTDEDRKKSFKKGKQGISDRRYIASLVKHEDTGSNRYEGKVEIIDKYEITSITLTFPLEGINGIDFLGEDNNKDLHIKTSRVEDKTLIFEVHEFDANGKYLSTIRMPEGDDYFRAVKSILVSKDGTIDTVNYFV